MVIKNDFLTLEVFCDGRLSIQIKDIHWDSENSCFIDFKDKQVYFSEMKATQEKIMSGIGEGIRTHYSYENIEFETYVWVEKRNDHIHLELNPLKFDCSFDAIYWPASFTFDENREDWITLINQMQGIMIPNTFKEEMNELHFNGQFCSSAAYMPWYAQIKENQGYLMISKTPWDSAYQINHIEGKTSISMRHLPSLNQLRYRRMMDLVFVEDATIVRLCKTYRKIACEEGKVVTLKEKAARNERVNDLVGCAILHKGIKTHISKDSIFYNEDDLSKNDHIISFKQRVDELKQLYQLGLKKAYLHLDGWGQSGYDNQHPDILPVCKEAGGIEGLKELADVLHEQNYLFGLHDQYRDYYFDAPSFDEQWALHQENHIFEQCLWAGGRQSYLCTTQAPYYVKRNFDELLSYGIQLDASYLDVFTCNEPDECFSEHHKMTRKECLDYRLSCFQFLDSKKILSSSEEVNEWALSSLVFAHYAPYDFMLRKPNTPRVGIPVPLWNLVYHDCVMLPWPMEKNVDGEDRMLYALLNGGMAYVSKEGAYPNTDGAFENDDKISLEEEIKRSQIVSSLHEKVAFCEMIDFGFVDHYNHQYSVFSDGTRVEINLEDNTYNIKSL